MRNPSLNGSTKLKELLELRNSKLGSLVAKDKLFLEDEQTSSPKKGERPRQRARRSSTWSCPMRTGSITVKTARLAREDLQVIFQEKHRELLLNFLKTEEIQFKQGSRKYQKTGKFSKKKADTLSDSD